MNFLFGYANQPEVMRPTKGVTQVACHSFCSCFVACFIVTNVAVTFDP